MNGPKHMMGFESPGDQKVPVPVRDWNALKLATWRSRIFWEAAAREAISILERCRHAEGCPSIDDETEPCLGSCPDREQRMSASVILNAGRMFAPIDAKKAANDPYFAPSREYFSEVLASFAATQMELEAFRMKGVVDVPPNPEPATLLPRAPEKFPIPEEELPEDETHPEA